MRYRVHVFDDIDGDKMVMVMMMIILFRNDDRSTVGI